MLVKHLCISVGKLEPRASRGANLLTDQFCDEARVPRGATPEDLLEYLRTAGHDCLDGLLASDDAKSAAIASLAQIGRYSVRVVRQLGNWQEKYCSVHIDGEASEVRVALLGNCQTPAFPTDMENLIFWAIIQPGSVIGSTWFDTAEGRSLEWRKRMQGLAVVAEPLPTQDFVGRTVAALFGLEDSGIGSAPLLGSVSANATELHIAAPTRALNPVQARLFFEAVATNHPKWRFLSFYRILENAYLTNIKKVLIDEFDKDAGRAVEEAKKKLQSEVNQLVDLMTENHIDTEFLAFNAEFDCQIAAGNQYITALDRGAQSEALYRSEVSKKAVLRFYKMRCSIAHAGTSSVIYEQLQDSADAMIALLPSVEAIALKSLSISVR